MLTGSCHCKAVGWSFEGDPGSATACNCTICRRYGALWIYGWRDENIRVSGPSREYVRGPNVGYHFCPTCGCVTHYRDLAPDAEGRVRMAVNLRIVDHPNEVADLFIDHFEGLDTFEDLPRDGRRVRDMWF
jgi:hypothetical protein